MAAMLDRKKSAHAVPITGFVYKCNMNFTMKTCDTARAIQLYYESQHYYNGLLMFV